MSARPATPSLNPSGEGMAPPAIPSPVPPAEVGANAAAEPSPAPSPMELLIRLRPAVDDERYHDVVVALDGDHRIDELIEALSASVGAAGLAQQMRLMSLRTGERLDRSRSVGEVDLVSGDELVLDLEAGDQPPRPAAMPLAGTALALDVIAGPDSGRSHLLLPGRVSLGRRASVDITIDDPSVSRHHLDLQVDRLDRDGWRVIVHPAADAANGVTINDHHIDAAQPITAADVIGVGGTRLVVRRVERPIDERIDRLGQIDFHRTPYRPTVVGDRDATPIGPIPERPEPRRFQIFAVLAPLAAGLMMYAFTKQVTFLALTLISPVVMIANAVDDRRTGRRRFRQQLAEFREGLVETRATFEQLRHDERIERLRSAPDLADLIRRAELRTIDLWSRGRDSIDALTLRLGLGASTVRFPIELDRGGDDDLRDEARDAVAGLDRIDNVPVTIDLCTDPVLGIHGEAPLVDGVTASLIVQAATLHSPEDLTLVGAVGVERGQQWMKWLPHLRSVTSPLSGSHLVTDRRAADALVRGLIEVAHLRTDRGEGFSIVDEVPVWPRVLLVLDDDLGLDPAEISRLLDVAPAAGISVIWLAANAAGVPRQASRILDVRRAPGAAMVGRLWSTDPSVAEETCELEHLRRELAERAARALAPVRDASTASQATSIPRTAPLLDVLGTGQPSAAWIADRWTAATGYDLRFEIGIGSEGPLTLDLVNDGPHTLIGGTSGAGKSELLQSMVAALAARYSPTRLNFLFVDYKGGASSQVFERLPHTVGYVTNLSADLSLRALTSLRAELDRRMAILEGRAKDLEEMLERYPDEAPASLVIVVDEFATLVKEVPEFVAGIIDIAQRGRSLGIHLVLATQRPSGSVNENILANTNLRISLRMLDRTESSAIIDSPDAADIPVPLRGRALARLGPRQLVEFQSAFAGASVVGGATRPPVLVTAFDRTDASPRQVGGPAGGADADIDPITQLEVLLDAIVDADASLALPAPRRPWREVLPEIVELDRVRTDDLVHGTPGDADRTAVSPGRFVTIGMVDAPEQQAQHPAVVDLETGGGWLIFGSGGSGKTTLLRTIAASVSQDSAGGDVAIVALDFASRGLMGLAELPEVVDVATGDDLEAVTRRLVQLDGELERRRRLLSDAGAEHLTAYHRDVPGARDAVPRIIVLIDGFGGLQSTLMESSGTVSMTAVEEWGDRVQRLVVDGRQVGIHTVITADRRNAVPSRIHSAVSNRLILRHADENGYAEHAIGAERARHLALSPGRGLLDGATLVQVASVSGDPSARAQQLAIGALAEQLERPAPTVLVGGRLPDLLDRRPATPSRAFRAEVGLADVSGSPVELDLDWSHAAVCGPARSGRSTALDHLATGLGVHHDLTIVGPAQSALRRRFGEAAELAGVDPRRVAFGWADELAPVLDRLATQVAAGAAGRPPILVVDDADALDDPALAALWERLVHADGLRIVMSLEQRSMSGYTTSAVVNAARRARRLLMLQPDDPAEFLQVTGVRLPTRPGLRAVPGRGVLLADRQPTIVQVPVVP